ncbi:MAG: phage tail protein [Alphaproteobacteria bacterium]|nr:phage tail protein [Alphaproteobacteria bacterium]
MALIPQMEIDNYIGAWNFRVKIDGVTDDVNQGFIRISGVVSQSEPMEFMHGVDPYVRKAPGRASFEDMTLERVYNGTDAFYEWRLAIEEGTIDRKDVVIELMKPDGSLARTTKCINAYPSRWELPEMDTSGSSGAVERITLTMERVITTS